LTENVNLISRETSKERQAEEEIVAEHLTGNYTYRELGIKYDITFLNISD